MKITESQLRTIISNAINEALDPSAVKTANSYINHKGGYTTNQRYDGLGGSLRQMFGAKNDSNGQRDWENSANEMQGAIRAYSNEIKRLTRAYNLITGKQSTGWSDERKAKAAQTRNFNKQWKSDNGIDGNAPMYQNVGAGNGIDPAKFNKQRDNVRQYNNAVANRGQQWFGTMEEEIGESFLSKFFGKNNAPDEVEQICTNWKQYVGDQAAAQKILDKINEYKSTVQKLKAIINQGIKGGHIQNAAAIRNAQMRAARNGAGNQLRSVAESKETGMKKKFTLNEEQLRNLITESIKNVLEERAFDVQ